MYKHGQNKKKMFYTTFGLCVFVFTFMYMNISKMFALW